MQQMQPQSRTIDVEQYNSEIQVVFSQVYLLMTLGLVITAIVAAWVSVTPSMLRFIYSSVWVPIGLMVAQIALVIVLSAAITRLSTGVGCCAFPGLRGPAGRLVISHPDLLHAGFDHHDVPDYRRDLRGDEYLWLCHQT